MLNLKKFLWFFVLIQRALSAADGNILNDIINNKTALGLMEELLTRQIVLSQLDILKSSNDQQMQLRSYNKDYQNNDSLFFDIRIDEMPEKCHHLEVPTNCDAATACTRRSGFYHINPKGYKTNESESILVQCDIDPDDGGSWTIVQRRQDGSVDFYRPWDDYQSGFGDIEGEFFIGLDKLHALTNGHQGPQELMIRMEMEDGKGVSPAYARYDSFAIGPACEKYVLKRIGKYSGNAGDSLHAHVGCKFTTKDQDNDAYSANCAESFMGAWWYAACHTSNLNGHYGDVTHGKGINWLTLSGHTKSLKYVQMMIRRRRN